MRKAGFVHSAKSSAQRRLIIVVQLVVLCGTALAQKPHLLMISVDGMKPEYVTQAREHNLRLSVLERFLAEGKCYREL
jgi:hypothetical protein